MATFPQFSTCWPKQHPKFPSVSCFCEYILALNCRQPKLIEVMNLLPKWFLGCAYNLLFIFLCSVAKWYPTLCDPIDFSMIGFPVFTISCSLLKFMSIESWCHPTVSSSVAPFSSCPQSFPAPGAFPMSQLLSSQGQSIGASALASVLPMNTQGWFPLGLTGLISLQCKGLSRVFSSTTVRKYQFFGTSLS